jgi:hypothetical protein
MQMTQLSWLYARGAQSVRLVREENAEGCHLVVHGPEAEIATYAFPNVAECMKRQAEIETGLQAAGYQLDTTSSDVAAHAGDRVAPSNVRSG